MHGGAMNIERIYARIGGALQEIQSRKWSAFAIACAVIAGFNLVSLVFSFALWWSLPLTVTAYAISWALWWPMNCATWLGWIAMLFRLIVALAVSNVAWVISGWAQ